MYKRVFAIVVLVMALVACSPEETSTVLLGDECSSSQLGNKTVGVAIDGSAVDVVCRISTTRGAAMNRWYLDE